MSNKANQESICTNGTLNILQSPQGAENRAGTQTLVDTSAEQKARDLYIQAESCHDRAVPPAEQQAAPKAAPAWADQAVIEYRYTGGTHWCPLGPAERMKPDFDGVYRLQGGVFPVEQAIGRRVFEDVIRKQRP